MNSKMAKKMCDVLNSALQTGAETLCLQRGHVFPAKVSTVGLPGTEVISLFYYFLVSGQVYIHTELQPIDIYSVYILFEAMYW